MIKVVAIAIICATIIIYLKSINSDLTLLATVASGIIILWFTISYLDSTFSFLNRLSELSGLDDGTLSVIFKITTIGYLIEFGADIIDDFGLKSLSNKLILVGKLAILSVALPVFYGIINSISVLFQ